MKAKEALSKVVSSSLYWIFIAVCLLGINLIAGYNGLYGQDSYEYLRYSKAIHDFFLGGPVPGSFYWPPLFPLSGAVLGFIFPAIFALQITSIISFGLTLFFLGKILQALFPGRSGGSRLFSTLFFVMSPFILRYSSSVMSEPMALMFITGFLYFYLRYTQELKPGYFLLLVTFGAAAINTRYPSLVIIIIPFIHASILFFRNLRILFLPLAVLIPVLIFLPDYYFQSYQAGSVSGNAYLNDWSIINFFSRHFITIDGTGIYIVPNILFVFSNLVWPGFIFTGIILLLFTHFPPKNRLYPIMLISVILVHALFLAGLPMQNQRLLVPVFTAILVLYFPAFIELSGWLKKTRRFFRILTYLSVILIQSTLFTRAYLPFYHDNKTERYICKKMAGYPGKTIYTFNIDQALKACSIQNRIINLYYSRFDEFQLHALVLFNPGSFSSQWKGMNPMLNWERLNKDYHLKIIESFPDGWNLYEIT